MVISLYSKTKSYSHSYPTSYSSSQYLSFSYSHFFSFFSLLYLLILSFFFVKDVFSFSIQLSDSIQLSEKKFICGVKENFFAIVEPPSSVTGIKAEKLSDDLWKITFSDENSFTVISDTTNFIWLEKICFRKLRVSEIKIRRAEKDGESGKGGAGKGGEKELMILDFYLESTLPELQTENLFSEQNGENENDSSSLPSTSPSFFSFFGKITSILTTSDKLISLTYRRKFPFPYEDVVLIFFGEYFIFERVKIPSLISLDIKTEPEAYLSVNIGGRNYKFTPDRKGDLNAEFEVFPGEKYFTFIAVDKYGNKTEKKVEIKKYPSRVPHFVHIIEVGHKLVVFLDGVELPEKDLRKKGVDIQKIRDGEYVLIPPFGRFTLKIGDKEFLVSKPPFPYRLTVHIDHDVVFADGTSRARVSAVLKDIFGNLIEDFPIEISAMYGKISGGFYTIKKMPSGLTSYQDVFDTIWVKYGYLSAVTKVQLVPGPPHTIDVVYLKDTIKGDGKDTALIEISILDAGGNLIREEPHIILPSGGNLNSVDGVDIGRWKISMSFFSRHNDTLRAIIKVRDVETEASIKVIGKSLSLFSRGILNFGTNFGIFLPSVDVVGGVTRYFHSFIMNGGLGLGGGLISSGNFSVRILRFFPSFELARSFPIVIFGTQVRVGLSLSIPFSVYSMVLDYGGEKLEDTSLRFGLEPKLIFILPLTERGNGLFSSLSFFIKWKGIDEESIRIKGGENFLFFSVGYIYAFD